MFKFITTALALVMINSLHAQVDSNSVHVKDIRDYIQRIDSIIGQRMGKTLTESISEGPISAKHDDKIYKGGYTLHTIETFRGDSVFRIVHHDNLDKNRTETFYLRNNKLVFASIDLQDNPNTSLYRREEYYQPGKDKPIVSVLVKDELPEEDLWRVEYSLQKKFTQTLEFSGKKL
ncbi:MAG TPA: hypothetical protein VHM26_15885 [Chitinophagaceae bacterium]|jgi:hypothetical protein|nr:hypothetical protein [Chitinophagaceae bacterium]